MTLHDPKTPAPANARGDLILAALAFGSAAAGMILGGPPLLVALIALAWPLGAFVAFGHLAGRGAVMVCIVSAMAAGMGTGGSGAWSAVGLMATIDLMALAGGRAADRMAPVSELVEAHPVVFDIPVIAAPSFVRSARPTLRTRLARPARIERSA